MYVFTYVCTYICTYVQNTHKMLYVENLHGHSLYEVMHCQNYCKLQAFLWLTYHIYKCCKCRYIWSPLTELRLENSISKDYGLKHVTEINLLFC